MLNLVLFHIKDKQKPFKISFSRKNASSLPYLVIGAKLFSQLERLSTPLDVVGHEAAFLALLLDQQDDQGTLRT